MFEKVKRTAIAAALCGIGLMATSGAASAALVNAKPNIVVFLTDDHSKPDSTVYGDKTLHTPNMQRLADSGVTFENAYVASPTCAPSRAALLTGLMPARNGAEPNHSKPRADIKKWPAYFHDLGYEVVAYGKVSHYKHTIDYGFDSFAHDTFHDDKAIPAAVKFLEKRDRNSTRPLCFMVGTNWPHVPWPDKIGDNDPSKLRLPADTINTTATRRARAQYAKAVQNADHDLGLVMDAVDKNLGDDTVILMSGDHGAQWPFAKWNCYEAGLNVPLIVRWPGVAKSGSRSDAMVSWIDFLPTLLEVAGGKAPADIDGKSFADVLRAKSEKHRSEIFASHSGDGQWNIYPIRSVRQGQWKYIRNLHPDFAFTTHIDLPGELGRMNYWKTWQTAAKTSSSAEQILKKYHQRPAEELYDLTADPHEQHNLANDTNRAGELARLRTTLDDWMKAEGDQQKTYGKPRMLSNPKAYGPEAEPMKN